MVLRSDPMPNQSKAIEPIKSNRSMSRARARSGTKGSEGAINKAKGKRRRARERPLRSFICCCLHSLLLRSPARTTLDRDSLAGHTIAIGVPTPAAPHLPIPPRPPPPPLHLPRCVTPAPRLREVGLNLCRPLARCEQALVRELAAAAAAAASSKHNPPPTVRQCALPAHGAGTERVYLSTRLARSRSLPPPRERPQ